MNIAAALANSAWLAASLPEYLRFRRAVTRVEETQRRLLQSCIRCNAETAFGRRHDFAGIRCWEDYTERVPVQTYEGFADSIERIAAGQQGVLTAAPVRLFEPSSGSSGAVKRIPYTAGLQAEYRRAVAVWITALFLGDPRLAAGRAYWSLTPPGKRKPDPEAAVPTGFDDDSAYLGGFAQRLVGLTLATPSRLRSITDSDEFWKVTAASLSSCHDLRFISAWHPSFVLLLRHKVREYLGSEIDPWPNLRLISCWGDAQAATILPDLQAAFPGVTIQPKGLLATEGVVTIPLADTYPLAIRSHFFEFEDAEGTIHPPWNLHTGNEYSVILTTGGGLYRYALRDRVRVTGVLGDTPCLRFLGKTDKVSDQRGEKLNEAFVAECLHEAFASFGITPRFAMLAPDTRGGTPCYTLFIESDRTLPATLAEILEKLLRRGYHYDLCLRLGQLRPLRVIEVRAPAFEAYARGMVRRGMRLGDVKPTSLSPCTDWPDYFEAAD